MTAVNPPYVIQSRTDHTAVDFRRYMMTGVGGANLGATSPRGGVQPTYGNRLAVVGSASAMQVTVDTGLCIVPNGTAWAGGYHCFNDASVTLSISAANATLYRRDLIIAQVLDTAYGDGSSLWQLAVVQGANNASSPAPLPTQPARSLLLGIVNVDPTITNLSGKVSDQRTYLSAGGVIPAPSTALPATPVNGTMAYETDNDVLRVYSGFAWRFVSDAGWKTFTPGIANAGTITWSTRTGRYKQLGEHTYAFHIWLVVNTVTGDNNPMGVDLPFDMIRTYRMIGVANFENGTNIRNGHWVTNTTGSDASLIDRVRIASTTLTGRNDIWSTNLFAAGDTMQLSGVVEST
jgi:hypothetical protein